VDPLPITIVGEATDLRYSVQTTLFVSYNTFIAARRTANPAAAQQPVFPAAIVVTPNPGISPEQLARTITQTVTGTDALSRAAAAAAQPGVASVNQSFGLLILLTVIVVVMVMAFFFLILTVQKQNAFTLLRAAGASKGYLRRAILSEVVVVLAGGLLCGFVLLALGVLVINQIFPATVNPNAALGYGIFLCVLGFLGALFALARIRKFRPENAANAPALGGLA
jgi:putative ABC transport system permease protein